MKKLFLFDIDGTILDGSRGMFHVSDKTKYAMEQLSKDNYVFIASGRCKGLLNEEMLSLPVNGYILCNGGYIEVNDKQVFSASFDPETIKKIIDSTLACDGYYVLETLDFLHTCDLESCKYIKFLNDWSQNVKLCDIDQSINTKYHVAMLGFTSEKMCLKAEEELNGIASMVRHNGFKSYDVNIKGIDKGVAAIKTMEILNINKEDTYCFGDGINDLEMLQAVGNPIIMANAAAELKQYGFIETLDVLDDGVYDYLLRNSLIKAL